jgi:hypothetical protein
MVASTYPVVDPCRNQQAVVLATAWGAQNSLTEGSSWRTTKLPAGLYLRKFEYA